MGIILSLIQTDDLVSPSDKKKTETGHLLKQNEIIYNSKTYEYVTPKSLRLMTLCVLMYVVMKVVFLLTKFFSNLSEAAWVIKEKKQWKIFTQRKRGSICCVALFCE